MKTSEKDGLTLSVQLLLGCSTMAHLFSAPHGPIPMACFILVLVGAPKLTSQLRRRKWWILTLNALTLGYLLFGLGQVFVIKASPLLMASSFLLVLLANKLLGPVQPRDKLQLLLLSLLQMVLATALSSDFWLGLLFVAYTIILPFPLAFIARQRDVILFRHMEQYPSIPADKRVIIRKRTTFVLGCSGLALLIGTALFFIFIPRLGFGFFAAAGAEHSMTGFSSRVDLGDFGRIQTNRKPVMRVRVEGDPAVQLRKHYWRGISLDRYENGRWSKSHRQKRALDLPKRGYLNLQSSSSPTIRQEIFLEPLSEKVLFGKPKITALSRCDGTTTHEDTFRVYQDAMGDLYYQTSSSQTVRYCVLSAKMSLKPAQRSLTMNMYTQYIDQLSPAFRRTYLQVPEEPQGALADVLNRIDLSSAILYEKATQVAAYLGENYRYTLDRKKSTSKRPIEDFLTENPSGHCEFFASAMVLLLRQGGIAARLVNGFAGGRQNKFGEYFLVHQGNAHSWVEVFFPEKNCDAQGRCEVVGDWHIFDPTPSSEALPEERAMWMDLIDALRLRWTEYVVRYNLRKQLSWLNAMAGWIQPQSKNTAPETSTASRAAETTENELTGKNFWILFLLALVSASMILWWLRRILPTQKRHRIHEATELFHRFAHRYEALGVHRTPFQTAEEFLHELKNQGVQLGADEEKFVQLYSRCRFEKSTNAISALKQHLYLIEAKEPSKDTSGHIVEY